MRRGDVVHDGGPSREGSRSSGTVYGQTKGFFGEKVQLPDEEAGIVMVFKTYDRISYALVMEASEAIQVLDGVVNPS